MAMNPRLLRPTANDSPASIPGLALWLDAAAADALYTTDAGPVTAVSSPLDISGCVFWLDASNTDTVSVSGSDVTSWTDAINAVSLTPTGSVTVGASLNGLATVRLNGAGTKMIGSGTLGVTDDHVILMVLRPYATANTSLFSFGRNSANQLTGSTLYYNAGLRYITKNSGAWATDVVTNSGATLTLGQPFLATARRGSSALAVGSGGMLPIAVAGTSGNLQYSGTDWNIGGFDGNALDADIAEIIVFNTALSTSDRARVEAYLAAKWGISGVHAPAVTASDPVGYWRDRSGNGRHATQSTAASRPVVGSLNGRNAIGFVALDSTQLELSNIAIPASHTVLGVFTRPTAARHSLLLSNGTAGANNRYSFWWFTDNVVYQDSNGSFTTHGTASTTTGSFAVAVRRTETTGVLVRRSGTVVANVTTGTGVTSAASGNWNFLGRNGSANFMQGDMCEIILYERALSDGEIAKVERYLARRWGITLAPQVSNAEAQDWISRVYANGGTVSTSTASAVSTFCDAIEAAGIRDRFARLNLFCGSSLNAALVPLYKSFTFGGASLGNATDTNNAFVGVGTDYAETGASGGLQGNGTSKRLDTGLNQDDIVDPPLTGHMSIYDMGFAVAGTTVPMGSYTLTTAAQRFSIERRTTGRVGGYGSGGINAGDATNPATGAHLLLTRRSATDLEMYANAVGIGTNAASVVPADSGNSFGVFAVNRGDSFTNHYAGRLAGYSAGLDMTAGQISSFYTAMQAFQTALGRNV